MTHFDLYTVIDMPLWDKANWVATVFLSDRKGEKLPCLGLAFRDRDAATRIFSAWRKRFGDVDTYEEIRVAIIEGDLPNETPGYTVHVSPNVEGMRARAKAEGTNVEENDFFVV